jgi:hypothetical protein
LRHGLADDVRPADDDRVEAGQRAADSLSGRTASITLAVSTWSGSGS